MPHKHGLSHALATLVCTVIAAMLGRTLAVHLPMDVFFRAAEYLNAILYLSLSADVIAITLLATILSFIWGIGFYYLNKE